ncbi:unnamed protein product [Tilletia laevis]|uniref:Uncharacterized protein n=2 Tax=Tilletia TaxID=13289 RepID=A0A177U042_9BASI|nr:hypothetical protein CF336_g7448 [Tilletia laevis]KAE8248167.1 hypothetical protein A4X03_0g6854 [Tilletia caries]KAE8187307.1 hypothetical protein CF335_g7209 [Tilletia laevis]CAD6885635.1 unnamed protein product [Tilletia caries]CAD6898080.1 unnamed protein product [Tilletia laevis]
MGDIYDVFSLPPPPPPTVLSLYDGPDRARLPNFLESDDPVAAARDYLHGQIVFICIPGLWYHVKVVTALAGVIVATALAVIVRRLLQRTLWILRIKQSQRGPLIVPNAIMIFAGVEGLFVIVFLAFLNFCQFAWEVKKQPLSNLILWIALTWCPLIAGPIWSAFGVWHARPPRSIQHNIRTVKQPKLCGMKVPLPKPLFISIFWLMVPFIQLLSIFGPAFKGNRYRSEAVRLYYKWNEEYANATELTRPMLIELQAIWNQDLKAFHWLAITMFIWFAWTFVLFFGHTFVNLRLLLPLRAQLKALRRHNARATVSGIKGFGAQGADRKSQIESVQLPLETPRLKSLAANYVGSRIETVDFQACDRDEDAIAVNEHWGLRAEDLREDAVNTSFFPPTKPSAVVRPTMDSETSEQYLRAAYRHFLFQGVTIAIAVIYFGEVSVYIALTVYSASERRRVCRTIDIAFVQVMWGCALFTLMVFISIILRTYEPMLVNLLHNNNSPESDRPMVADKRRSIRMSKLVNFHSHSRQEPGQSFSSSSGTPNLTAPTPDSLISPVMKGRPQESDASDDGLTEPEIWSLMCTSGTSIMKPGSILSHTPITSSPHRSNSAQDQTYLLKADMMASTRTPEYETQAYIPRHDNSFAASHTPIQATLYTPIKAVEVLQSYPQIQTDEAQQLGSVRSTASLNDRSLREMPSRGTDVLGSLNELPASTLPTSKSRAKASLSLRANLGRTSSISSASTTRRSMGS